MPAFQRFLLTWTCISIRILIVTSVYNIVVFLTSPEHESWKLECILPVIILLHHGLSVWNLSPVFLDWLFILGELAALFARRFYTWRMDRWTMSKYTVLFGSLIVQILALGSLLIIRSIMIYFQPFPSGLRLPLNLLALDYDSENSWRERVRLIFGRSLWSPKWRKGKRGLLFTAIRASLALAIFLGMLIFAIFCLIIWPASETGMVPVKTMISPGVRWDFQSLSPGWNVFVILDRDLNASVVDVRRAIDVKPLWEDPGLQVELCAPINRPPKKDKKPQCEYRGWEFNDDIDSSLKYNTPTNVAVNSFHFFCPNRCSRDLTLLEFLRVPARDTMPDLLVTVDFTLLGIPPLSSTVGGSRLKTVGIIVAFIDNIGDVLRVSTQTSLLPGMHLLGRVAMEFRSLFARSYLAAFGLASPSDTFIAGTVYDLTQDPAPPSQDTTTASLRLYVPSDRTDWRFIQEDREKSVLAGFAAIGGLWISVTGIFSFFFGGTLAFLLWGQKPLSIFGLLDKPWKETLWEELNDGIKPHPNGSSWTFQLQVPPISHQLGNGRASREHRPSEEANSGEPESSSSALLPNSLPCYPPPPSEMTQECSYSTQLGNERALSLRAHGRFEEPESSSSALLRNPLSCYPPPPSEMIQEYSRSTQLSNERATSPRAHRRFEEPNPEEPTPNDANVNCTLDKNDWIMIKLLRQKLVDLGPLEDC